ncbi:hypothetical protein BDF21DRAFT_447221 [Thamnidium elegans]|nr:hypothetical protein BDF21DRAFT_447221 [Thamnidium elegans]
MIIIHLRSIQFSVIGTVVGCHEVDEFDMSSIVPSEFKSDLSKYTITSLAPALSDSSIFDADFGQLFQEQYLSLTHTKYFSTRGARMENLNAHPKTKGTFPVEDISASVVSLVLQSYMVNFKNMWTEKKTINKFLDKVFNVLLRLHLAPNRELEPKEKSLSKSYAHYILCAEKKKKSSKNFEIKRRQQKRI